MLHTWCAPRAEQGSGAAAGRGQTQAQVWLRSASAHYIQHAAERAHWMHEGEIHLAHRSGMRARVHALKEAGAGDNQ